MVVEGTSSTGIQFLSSAQTQLRFGDVADTGAGAIIYTHADNTLRLSAASAHRFTIGGTEAARIDSSGNFLVGTTSTIPFTLSSGTGAGINSAGTVMAGAAAEAGLFNRIGSDGGIINLYRAGSLIGNIGVANSNNVTIVGTVADHGGLQFGTQSITPMDSCLQSI